jgi:hypothetical protein
MTQAAAGPNEDMEIGTRIIPEEPMAIVSLVPVYPPHLLAITFHLALDSYGHVVVGQLFDPSLSCQMHHSRPRIKLINRSLTSECRTISKKSISQISPSPLNT